MREIDGRTFDSQTERWILTADAMASHDKPTHARTERNYGGKIEVLYN